MSMRSPISSAGPHPHGVTAALRHLEHALDSPRRHDIGVGTWRWAVRQRMAGVRDLLVNEVEHPADGWLAARGGRSLRERNTLLGRLSELGPQILENGEVETVRSELKRLVGDIAHHVQRVHDLVYDEVELELGGSE